MNLLKAKFIVITTVFILFTTSSFSQLLAPFKLRYQSYIKGDITMISNNVVNRVEYGSDANTPYYNHTSTAKINDEFEMQYIDIDEDKSTFSSSSATLSFANNAKPKIVYAGLYWSSTYKYEMGGINNSSKYFPINEKRLPFSKIKLKLPNQENYIEVEGQTIYDGLEQKEVKDFAPYAEYADITKQIQALKDPTGVYTLANIKATQGRISGGVASGWTIFIVYEDPTKSGKFISSFDGFAGVTEKSTDININGFQTLPNGAINAKIACAALEGDNNLLGDQLLFSSNTEQKFTTLSNKLRTADNFFNSSITVEEKFQDGREPDSKNTLGYDACLLTVPNPNNSIISNNSTEATLRLKSVGDRYFMFFTSFSVEVIEPVNSIVASNEKVVAETPKFETSKITLAETNSKKPEETVAPVVAVVKTPQEIKQPVVDKSISENNTVENKIQTQPIVAESKKIITGKVVETNKTFINGIEKTAEEKPANVNIIAGKVTETNKIVAGTVTQETVVRHAENIPSAIPDVNKTVIKHEIKQDIKPQIKQEVKDAILADKESMKDEILKDLEAEILSELKTEIKQEVKKEVKQEVKEEFKKEYQEQIKQQLKEQLKKDLKEALVNNSVQKNNETPKAEVVTKEIVQSKTEVVEVRQKEETPKTEVVTKEIVQSKPEENTAKEETPKAEIVAKEIVQSKPKENTAKEETPKAEIVAKEIVQPKTEVVEVRQKEETPKTEVVTKEIVQPKTEVIEVLQKEDAPKIKKGKAPKPEADTSLAKAFFESENVEKAKDSDVIYAKLGTVSVGYYIIANVFSVKENATKFMKTLSRKGFDPSSFVNLSNGYTYVYIAKVQNEEDARQLFQTNFEGKYNDELWILGVKRN